MLRSLLNLLILGCATVSLSACMSQQQYYVVPPANSNVAITSPVPADKVDMVVPQGPHNCYIVKAGWHHNIWIPKHRVCQFQHHRGSRTWVAGYWRCLYYKRVGTCDNWEWIPAHWSKSLVVSY